MLKAVQFVVQYFFRIFFLCAGEKAQCIEKVHFLQSSCSISFLIHYSECSAVRSIGVQSHVELFHPFKIFLSSRVKFLCVDSGLFRRRRRLTFNSCIILLHFREKFIGCSQHRHKIDNEMYSNIKFEATQTNRVLFRNY